jgi:hypothetical protein
MTPLSTKLSDGGLQTCGGRGYGAHNGQAGWSGRQLMRGLVVHTAATRWWRRLVKVMVRGPRVVRTGGRYLKQKATASSVPCSKYTYV